MKMGPDPVEKPVGEIGIGAGRVLPRSPVKTSPCHPRVVA